MEGNHAPANLLSVTRSKSFDALHHFVAPHRHDQIRVLDKRASLFEQTLVSGMNDIECTEDHDLCFHSNAASSAAAAAALPYSMRFFACARVFTVRIPRPIGRSYFKDRRCSALNTASARYSSWSVSPLTIHPSAIIASTLYFFISR